MDVLPGIWSLSPIGALIGAVIVLYVWLGTGRMITKSSHERELAQAKLRGDEWKETAIEQREVNQEIRRQNAELIEAVRTSSRFFSAVTPPDALEDTGVPNVSS